MERELADYLGRTARWLVGRRKWKLGLTVEDLVHAGFIGYQESIALGNDARSAKRRARFAMVDELRVWYDTPHWRVRKETGLDTLLMAADEIPDTARDDPNPEPEAPALLRHLALTRAMHLCTPIQRRVLKLALDGESIDRIAELTGRPRMQVARSLSAAVRRVRSTAA